jgi:hypothetical protein
MCVQNKAWNRLHASQAEDLVYIYTSSKVLNQKLVLMDEATTSSYKQSTVFEESTPRWTC